MSQKPSLIRHWLILCFPWKSVGIFTFFMAELAFFYSMSTWSFSIASFALTWLIYRSWLVLRQPVDHLVYLLGHELPQIPQTSLLEINHDRISIHWKHPEYKQMVERYLIRVNGINIGHTTPSETSISIQKLPPGRYYKIRVVAVNATGFHASSDPICIRMPHHPDSIEDALPIDLTKSHDPPILTAYRSLPDASRPVLQATNMAREHSGSLTKRGPKKNSSVAQSDQHDQYPDAVIDSLNGNENVQELTDILAKLRQDIEIAESQEKEQQDEHQRQEAELKTRKDDLTQQLKIREEESRKLTHDVKNLEMRRDQAEKEKNALEKTLQQKSEQRQKMKADVLRWKDETAQMRSQKPALLNEKQEVKDESERVIATLREEQQEDLDAIKSLEDQIKETGLKVRSLLEEEETLATEAAQDNANNPSTEEVAVVQRIDDLTRRNQEAYADMMKVQYRLQETQVRFEQWSQRRSSQSQTTYSQNSSDRNINLNDIGHQNLAARAIAGRNGFNYNPDFRPDNAYFSSHIHLPSAHTTHQSMTQSEIDAMTGGAMTSPSAQELLPSDLLGEDSDEMPHPRHSSSAETGRDQLLPGLGTVPESANPDMVGIAAQSPHSFSSSQSHFSSRRESIGSSHHQRMSENQSEHDRRSIRSAESSSQAPAGSRFGFGVFSRQRGKTTSVNEGPAMGSLSRTQSQSMPRALDSADSLDLDSHLSLGGQKRGTFGRVLESGRRMVHSSRTVDESPSSSFATSSIDRLYPWSRTPVMVPSSLSRTTSIYSTENALPSSESQVSPWNDGLSRSNSARAFHQGQTPWATFPDRRQSIQADPKSFPQDIATLDEQSDEIDTPQKAPMQDPIGTRPGKGKAKISGSITRGGQIDKPQLNPKARDFRMFGREKKPSKSSTKSKRKSKIPSHDEDAIPSIIIPDDILTTPKASHVNEMNITSTRSSVASITDSQTSEPTTPMDSPSTSQPSSAKRDSFMTKIIKRQSSSHRFGLSGLKPRRVTATNGQSAEDTDDDGTGPRRSAENSPRIDQPGTPNTGDSVRRPFSLSSFKRSKSSKKEADAPSISSASITSEAGTGDEHDSTNVSGRESLSVDE